MALSSLVLQQKGLLGLACTITASGKSGKSAAVRGAIAAVAVTGP